MKQVLTIVREHWLALFLPAAVAVSMAAIVVRLHGQGPVVHEAHMYIEVGRGQIGRAGTHLTHEAVVRKTVQYLTRVAQVNPDRPLAGFLRAPELDNPDETIEHARVREFLEHLKVLPVGENTLLVSLTMEDTEPVYPARVLKDHVIIARKYLASAQGRTKSPEETSLEKALKDATDRLASARDGLGRVPFPSGLQSRLASDRRRLGSLRMQLDEVEAQLAGAKASRAALEKEARTLEPHHEWVVTEGGEPAGAAEARTRLRAQKRALEAERTRLLEEVTGAHPSAIELARRILDVDVQIARLEAARQPRITEKRINERFEANRKDRAAVDAEIARLVALSEKLGVTIRDIQRGILSTTNRFGRDRDLHTRREQELRAAEEQFLAMKRRAHALGTAMLVSQVEHGVDQARRLTFRQVTESPWISSRAASSALAKPEFVIFVAGLLGLVVGAFSAWGLERANVRIRSSEDVQQALGAPVLGVLGEGSVVEDPWSEPSRERAPSDPEGGGAWHAVLSILGLVLLGFFVYLMTSWLTGRLHDAARSGLTPAEQRLLQESNPIIDRTPRDMQPDRPEAPAEGEAGSQAQPQQQP